MKKFSFILNNFYSIFNPMPQGNNKNIDSYLDDSIRHSLRSETSEDFMYEMMKRVEIEKEFAREDRKTDKTVKFVIGGLVAVMILIAFGLPFFFGTSDADSSYGYYNIMIDQIAGSIEYFSIFMTDNLGIAVNSKTVLVLLISGLCIFLFSKADKLFLKKSLNQN
ncbi:MAG TPA: hypothetical protein PK294_00315 [Ignavibacteria bacterium]|nr:hypothetical protein [Ignavibacteria bacterium]HRA98852.1 hypothetical protein [Ignavibacteria bacterium]